MVLWCSCLVLSVQLVPVDRVEFGLQCVPWLITFHWPDRPRLSGLTSSVPGAHLLQCVKDISAGVESVLFTGLVKVVACFLHLMPVSAAVWLGNFYPVVGSQHLGRVGESGFQRIEVSERVLFK